jgi:uncharacterized integral membrane protein
MSETTPTPEQPKAPEPSTATMPPAPSARPAKRDEREGVPWRLIAFSVVLVYAVIFVILNADSVDVSFVFFSTRVSLIVALVLALLIGFLAGYLADNMRDRRRRRERLSTQQKP